MSLITLTPASGAAVLVARQHIVAATDLLGAPNFGQSRVHLQSGMFFDVGEPLPAVRALWLADVEGLDYTVADLVTAREAR